MRRSTAATVIVTSIALLAIAVAPVAAARPTSTDAAAAKARAEHDRIVRYWTAERIKSAKPRDFVRTPGGGFEALKGKPGGGGGGGGGAVTGASWSKGGEVVERTGKVLFTMGSSNYVCSASVVNDTRSAYSLVLTAAHCAYDEVAKKFATNWTYVPAFDLAPTFTCASSQFGCWTAQALVVHDGYASADGFDTQATVHDFAIAVVGAGGKSNSQLDALGSYAIAYPAISTGQKVYAFGYPAAGRYKGKDLVYCAGNTINDQYNDDLTWGVACNMTGGSSGGPWFGGFDEATGIGTLTSLNSYGYSGISNMYGPKFDGNTRDVVTAANGATANTIVP